MKYPCRPRLFEVEERVAQRIEMRDSLVELNARIGWEAFRPDLNRVDGKDRKSKAGAKPFEVELIFTVLVLTQLNRIQSKVRARVEFVLSVNSGLAMALKLQWVVTAIHHRARVSKSLVQLIKRDVKAVTRVLTDNHWEGALTEGGKKGEIPQQRGC
jgi:hypothetical protein